MKTTTSSDEGTEQGGTLEMARDGFVGTELSPREEEALDALLAHAPRYAPPAGFAERVLAALQAEEAPVLPALRRHPWYLRPYTWGSAAAAACLAATLCLLPLLGDSRSIPADSLAVDDALLVDEALGAIDDPDLISAICCVSSGAYSIATSGGASPY